ncbi:membrane protein [Knoellia sinensis KCTC 19936]|uniref:Membrane protein n=2 Tax=Knoellia TaxID=136099 RepID=A0A0A0J858_9MICO|nr:membrane protein [Knoellia sinensis KCTC 19936]
MTLITSMLERPLDPGYAAAAERRESAGLPRATSLRSWRLIVFAVIIGVLVGIAAMQLRGSETNRQKTKASLIERIEKEQAVVDSRVGEAGALRSEIAALDAETLRQVSGDLAADVERLSLVAGAVPVQGPGFVVTVDDAPSAGGDGSNALPREETEDTDGEVLDRDLQILTNSLWEAGAEAISVNGQRLTTTASIRFAGEAILVDFRPLKRPYVITAIGNPGTLPARFANGSGGTYLSTLKSSFGIRAETVVRARVTIPAAATLGTREAVPADRVNDSATPTSEGDSS